MTGRARVVLAGAGVLVALAGVNWGGPALLRRVPFFRVRQVELSSPVGQVVLAYARQELQGIGMELAQLAGAVGVGLVPKPGIDVAA